MFTSFFFWRIYEWKQTIAWDLFHGWAEIWYSLIADKNRKSFGDFLITIEPKSSV